MLKTSPTVLPNDAWISVHSFIMASLPIILVQCSKGTLALCQQKQRKQSISFLRWCCVWWYLIKLIASGYYKHTKKEKKTKLILTLEPLPALQQIFIVHSLILNANSYQVQPLLQKFVFQIISNQACWGTFLFVCCSVLFLGGMGLETEQLC